MTTDMTYKLMTRGPSDERTLFAHLSMGAHQTVIGNVILNRLEANDRRKVVQAFGEPSTMWFKRICSADDFKAYVPLVCYWSDEGLLTLGKLIYAVT